MAPIMRVHSLFAACLLGLPLAVPAQAPATPKPSMPANHPPIGAGPAKAAPSPWTQFADYTLTVKVPPKGDTGTWKFHTYADPADVLVELDTPGAKARTKGSILLVGGQIIAAKGFALEAGFEVDPLDAAIVNLKILTQLLDAAVPGGPGALTKKQAVNVREQRNPIVATTPSANAGFNAPWNLKGQVERTDAGTVAFRLELEVPNGEKPAERARWLFTGRASGVQKGRELDGTMSLAGWTAYSLGNAPVAKPSAHTSMRFGATRLPGPFATVKDLRAAVK